MDAYLESLVRKDESAVSEEVAEEVLDEVVDATEPVVEPEVAADTEPKVVDKLEEGEESNDDEIDLGEAQEPTSTVEPEPIPTAEPEVKPAAAKKADAKVEPTPTPASALNVGDIVTVKLIKVYKTPSVNQIAKNVTGNVTYLGRIGDFNIVSYMKHGYGLVKGYTLNDLN